MSALLSPYRYQNHASGSHHCLAPRSYRHNPSSFAVSPFYNGSQQDFDPFGFSKPFLSLFNDTFSQLDRLSSDLDAHLTQVFGDSDQPTSWRNLLTSTPKFDVKETDAAYILEGELPGIAKADIDLTFTDDHTLILKTQTSTFKQEGKKPEQYTNDPASSSEPSKQIAQTTPTTSVPENTVSEMSGATEPKKTENETVVTNTEQSTGVTAAIPASPTYHLAERMHSTFQRAFSFAGKIKHDEVKASLKDGVLTVTVPKISPEPEKEQKTRSVTVEDANETEDMEIVDGEKAKL